MVAVIRTKRGLCVTNCKRKYDSTCITFTSLIQALHSELALSWPDATHGVERVRRKIVCKERAIVIYPNAQSRVLSEPNLYMPVNAERKMWPSSSSKAVSLQLSLGRSIWITETPIYVHVKVDNASTRSVSDIKLELLRRQNTFSQTGLQGSFGLKPVTSTCETVAQVQASQMGWLLPMDPGMEDQATMMLQSPVSSIRVLLSYHHHSQAYTCIHNRGTITRFVVKS